LVLLPALLQADSASLCIANQKNKMCGETTYQHTLPNWRVSVTDVLARRVATVMAATGSKTSPISHLGTANNATGHVVTKMVKTAV
jgi:hypothetical protein